MPCPTLPQTWPVCTTTWLHMVGATHYQARKRCATSNMPIQTSPDVSIRNWFAIPQPGYCSPVSIECCLTLTSPKSPILISGVMSAVRSTNRLSVLRSKCKMFRPCRYDSPCCNNAKARQFRRQGGYCNKVQGTLTSSTQPCNSTECCMSYTDNDNEQVSTAASASSTRQQCQQCFIVPVQAMRR